MIAVERLPRVEQEYDAYLAFLAQNKIASENPVSLIRPTSKVEYKGRVSIDMGWAAFECAFEATRSPREAMKYELKIFAPYFGGNPCFRFCSNGRVHTNKELGDGLPARGIPTPHFHRVNPRGILYAYQTPALANPIESTQIVANPQLGTKHFCQEANLFSKGGACLAVRIVSNELDLSTSNRLGGANFPLLP